MTTPSTDQWHFYDEVIDMDPASTTLLCSECAAHRGFRLGDRTGGLLPGHESTTRCRDCGKEAVLGEYLLPKRPLDRVIALLNSAFLADPNAIHALLCNRIPCNQALADHPMVEVFQSIPISKGETKYYAVGALGILTGVCRELGIGIPAAEFKDGELVGFCEYVPVSGMPLIVGTRVIEGVCPGCGLNDLHKMCPAHGTAAYMHSSHPAWGDADAIAALQQSAGASVSDSLTDDIAEALQPPAEPCRECGGTGDDHPESARYRNSEFGADCPVYDGTGKRPPAEPR